MSAFKYFDFRNTILQYSTSSERIEKTLTAIYDECKIPDDHRLHMLVGDANPQKNFTLINNIRTLWGERLYYPYDTYKNNPLSAFCFGTLSAETCIFSVKLNSRFSDERIQSRELERENKSHQLLVADMVFLFSELGVSENCNNPFDILDTIFMKNHSIKLLDQYAKRVRALEIEIKQKEKILETKANQTSILVEQATQKIVQLNNQINGLEKTLVNMNDLRRSLVQLIDTDKDYLDLPQNKAKEIRIDKLLAQLKISYEKNGIISDINELVCPTIQFLMSLNTNQIVAITGETGTGKTTFVSMIAKALGAKCDFIEVQNNWTDNPNYSDKYPLQIRFIYLNQQYTITTLGRTYKDKENKEKKQTTHSPFEIDGCYYGIEYRTKDNGRALRFLHWLSCIYKKIYNKQALTPFSLEFDSSHFPENIITHNELHSRYYSVVEESAFCPKTISDIEYFSLMDQILEEAPADYISIVDNRYDQWTEYEAAQQLFKKQQIEGSRYHKLSDIRKRLVRLLPYVW